MVGVIPGVYREGGMLGVLPGVYREVYHGRYTPLLPWFLLYTPGYTSVLIPPSWLPVLY